VSWRSSNSQNDVRLNARSGGLLYRRGAPLSAVAAGNGRSRRELEYDKTSWRGRYGTVMRSGTIGSEMPLIGLPGFRLSRTFDDAANASVVGTVAARLGDSVDPVRR